MNTVYKVKQTSFEGPLDLLLNLIEKRKLFINDISLSQIADEYIEYIRNAQDFSLRESTDFVLIASALMLIKSKSLLPTLDLTSEEDQSIEDLERRLKILQRMRELSKNVETNFGKNIIFAKSLVKSRDIIFSPDEKITKTNIITLMGGLINNLPKKEIIPKKVVKKIVSIEEMIDNLTERIKSSIKMSFNDFSKKGKTEKINIVVSFLAMLELVKQGALAVQQRRAFEDIDMENLEIETPNYN